MWKGAKVFTRRNGTLNILIQYANLDSLVFFRYVFIARKSILSPIHTPADNSSRHPKQLKI